MEKILFDNQKEEDFVISYYNNIPLIAGANNCRYNIRGKCENKDILSPLCSFTILGIWLCSKYDIDTDYIKLDNKRWKLELKDKE